jgi:hypothetical protein
MFGPLSLFFALSAAHGMPAVTGATDPDLAVAIGYMLDSPRPLEAIRKGIAVADGLRAVYGIDTGDVIADREAAARRAQSELLDRTSFSEGEIASMARTLGYSLDPAVCGTTCENVRRLTQLELQKLALERFVAGALTPASGPSSSGSTPRALSTNSRTLSLRTQRV